MELLKRVVGVLRTDCTNYVDMPGYMDWQEERNIGRCVPWGYFIDHVMNISQIGDLFERRMQHRLQHASSYHDLHILDSVYRILCGWESLETPHDKIIQTIPSATYLEACGVKIKGKEFTSFEDIAFENGCLWVPFLRVYDDTEKYFRNLVLHEVLTRPGEGSASCYTFFMDDLMKTPEDVNLLVKKGVLLVNVGSHDIAGEMWKRINYNIPEPLVSDKFFTMSINVKSSARLTKNKLLFEFKRQYCSRPWLVLSIFAVTFVTIVTGIQTYVAVIGSDKMKPYFRP